MDKPGLLTGDWYTHWLDREDHSLTQQVRVHAIPAGLGIEDPPPLRHPRKKKVNIYPWIDFFAYWQVYELAEILKATVLFYPIRDTPDALSRIKNLPSKYEDEHKIVSIRVARLRREWAERQVVFDWISRYRTMLGAWNATGAGWIGGWEKVQEAAPKLLYELKMTPEDLKKGIRDTLLTLWHDWKLWKGKHDIVHRLIRLHLQEDIDRAVDFLRQATGMEIDLDDPFWGFPEDMMSRGWTPLPEVLPYEAFTAKADFPIQASVYLDRSNRLLPQPFNKGRLHEITVSWWSKSVTFRRFCLAFLRLHQFFYTEDDRIGLRESTPIDFLILCVLHAEKILRDRYLDMSKGALKAPDFVPLTLESAGLVLRSFKVKGSGLAIQQLRRKLNEKGDLHDLHANPRNPFVSEADFTHTDPLVRHLLACFSNFAILRNYAAHHDSLDDQLVSDPMAQDSIESMLVVTLTMLNASPSERPERAKSD
ncbi:MAG TPA: hypothetical protein VF789_10340 [Thermoanaerobaculia bacterium]